MKNLKSFLQNFLLLLISFGITFALCEYFYRKALFDLDNKSFDKYRKPPLYAADWDENYWKLLKIWHITPFSQRHYHPLVGWLNYTWWPKSLMHSEVLKIGNKRPVLLYGDSYAQSLDTARSVKNMMYNDSLFSDDFHFVNYGCGAYGLDQIYTLLKTTSCRIDSPIVIFSFLTLDLDRSVLNFRDGQKPHYSIDEKGELILDSTMLFASDIVFINKHPPDITSYLWRKFLYSQVNFFPEKATQFFTGELVNKRKIIRLNTKILESVISLLRGSNTDFIFLLWEAPHDFKFTDSENWRKKFITHLLNKNKVKYVWAKDFLPEKLTYEDTATFYKYYVPNDGHPTTLFYQIAADKIKNLVINKKYEINSTGKNSSTVSLKCHPMYMEEIDSTINVIKSDTSLLMRSKEISIERNENLEKSIYDYAVYFLWDRENKKK